MDFILKRPAFIQVNYALPDHLRGICDVDQMRQADLELLDEELRKKGSSLDEKKESGVIWRMGFPGMIVNVSRIEQEGGVVTFEASPIHPHRADLAYKADTTLSRNVAPLTVNALLIDSTNRYIVGVRGGSVEAGKIGIIPGGHTDYVSTSEVRNPLETLKAEFEEELGYPLDDGTHYTNAVFNNKDTRGVNVLYTVRTRADFPQISHNWRRAKDRGEHNSLLSVLPRDVSSLALTGSLRYGDQTYETTPFFQDCFKLASN